MNTHTLMSWVGTPVLDRIRLDNWSMALFNSFLTLSKRNINYLKSKPFIPIHGFSIFKEKKINTYEKLVDSADG